jgi:hypothetical protein
VKANVFGTPADVARMTEHFMHGMGLSSAIEGFLDGAGPVTKAAASGAASSLHELATALTDRVKPATVIATEIKDAS